jgi:hypothetical protein
MRIDGEVVSVSENTITLDNVNDAVRI